MGGNGSCPGKDCMFGLPGGLDCRGVVVRLGFFGKLRAGSSGTRDWPLRHTHHERSCRSQRAETAGQESAVVTAT